MRLDDLAGADLEADVVDRHQAAELLALGLGVEQQGPRCGFAIALGRPGSAVAPVRGAPGIERQALADPEAPQRPAWARYLLSISTGTTLSTMIS